MKRRLLLIAGCTAALAGASYAIEPAETLSPVEITGAIRTDEISVPSPGECFAAINKFERPAWSQLVRSPAPPVTTNRAALAMHLGTRVTDGFVAVEAQDSQRVKNIGRDIINLAKSLGISQTILARGNSISDFAENNEWNALREELDATENEVKLAMRGQKDDDLVSLVTVGAWLRGTQTACQTLNIQFRPEATEILRQPAVAAMLVAKLDQLPDRLRNDPMVSAAKTGLEQILVILHTNSDTPLTEDEVNTIYSIASNVVEVMAPIASDATPPAS